MNQLGIQFLNVAEKLHRGIFKIVSSCFPAAQRVNRCLEGEFLTFVPLVKQVH